jgi:hypothetical protein
MTSRSTVSLLALAGALALAGCNKADTGANTAAAVNLAAATDNEAAAMPPEDLPLPAGDNAVVEDESTAPAIKVVTVPAPAPSAPAADSAPLTDAIAAEQVIDTGTGITRVQQADGWAWLQDGQIIRTASADGHRVSYFRRGSTAPYLVQQDGRTYAYANGRVSHEYDDRGRSRTPDAQHQHEAQHYADQARQQHDRAKQASKTAPHVDRSRGHDDRGTSADRTPPRPQPSSTPDRRPGDHGRPGGNDHDRGHATPTPTPTPTPSPSTHRHDGQRPDTRGDHRGSRDDARPGGH